MSWRTAVVEPLVLFFATLIFAIFCIAPLQSMQGNPMLQSEFGLTGNQEPPPSWILPFDDSYIFIRYAQQAHRGHAFEWNTGEPSSGASSFLYPWILLPGQWLSDTIQGWSWWSRAVGVAGLWLLGLAAISLVRALGTTGLWPLATALAVVWSGPVGFGAMTGMESALNAAVLVFALSLWIRLTGSPHRSQQIILALLIASLPLMRPENLLLTLLGALAILLLPRPPLPRWTVPLLLVPSLGIGLLNFTLTGLAQPTAVVTKSWLGIAFPDLVTLIKLYFLGVWTEVLPVYAGIRGFLLWPPVGWLALASALAALRYLPREHLSRQQGSAEDSPAWRSLRPVALVWLVLVALCPMSSMPTWQGMRHHHSGLVCAWILALAGAAIFLERITADRKPLAGRVQLLSIVPGMLLLGFIPTWGGLYAQKAIEIHHRHGPAVAWLEESSRERVLLLNDAGILSLAHDGEAIDVMGLGTPAMARAYRHGAGALVEALARRDPLPSIGAANLDVFRLQDLLATPLIPGLDPESQTLVAEIDVDLLDNTVLPTEGIDFAHLESEARAELRWRPAPDPYLATFALRLAGEEGQPQLQGCRPVAGRIEIALHPDRGSVRARLASLASGPSAVLFDFSETRPSTERAGNRLSLTGTQWTQFEAAVPVGSRWIWFEAVGGMPTPCLESLALL